MQANIFCALGFCFSCIIAQIHSHDIMHVFSTFTQNTILTRILINWSFLPTIKPDGICIQISHIFPVVEVASMLPLLPIYVNGSLKIESLGAS